MQRSFPPLKLPTKRPPSSSAQLILIPPRVMYYCSKGSGIPFSSFSFSDPFYLVYMLFKKRICMKRVFVCVPPFSLALLPFSGENKKEIIYQLGQVFFSISFLIFWLASLMVFLPRLHTTFFIPPFPTSPRKWCFLFRFSFLVHEEICLPFCLCNCVSFHFIFLSFLSLPTSVLY